MAAHISTLGFQIQAILKNLHEYFKSSPVSIAFFVFLLIVIVLDILKLRLIRIEKKNGFSDQACKFLDFERGGSVCRLPSCEQGFKDRKNSCEGCTGKILSITNADAVEQITASVTWKRSVVLIANCSRSVLPYASFLYTLFIAIFEKGS